MIKVKKNSGTNKINSEGPQDLMKIEEIHKSSITEMQKPHNEDIHMNEEPQKLKKKLKDSQRVDHISTKCLDPIYSTNYRRSELDKSSNCLKSEKVNQDSSQGHKSSRYFDPIDLENNKNPEPDKPSHYLKSDPDESSYYSVLEGLNIEYRRNQEELENEVLHQSGILTNEKVIYKNSNRLKNKIKALQTELESSKQLISHLQSSIKISQREVDLLNIEKKASFTIYLNLTQEISNLEQSNYSLEQSKKDLEQSNKELEKRNKSIKRSNKHLKQSNQNLEQSRKDLKQLNKELKQSNEEASQKLLDVESQIQEYKKFEVNILDENQKLRNDLEIYMKNNLSLSKYLNESSIKFKELKKVKREKEDEIMNLINEISVLKQEIANMNKHLKSNIQEELQNIRNITLDANKYSRSCSKKLIQIDRYKFDEKYGGIKETYDSLQQEIHELLLEDQSRSIRRSKYNK